MYPSRKWAAEVERRLTQHGDDIASLYEINERIEGKVDQLDGKVDRLALRMDKRFTQVDARLDAMDKRFDGMDARIESLSGEMALQRGLLEQVLEHLDRR